MSAFDTLAARGLSVFPLVRPTKRPALKWSHYQTAHASVAERAAWAAANHNTGVATGIVSGCIVLDLDSTDSLLDAMERGLPDTMRVATPRGFHYYFAHPGGAAIANRASFLPGMDIRGDGGYVVGPGSFFTPTPDEAALGKVAGPYVLDVDAPLAPVPEWLAAMLVREAPDRAPAPARDAETTSAYGLKALHGELARLADAQQGANLNDTINRAAFAIGQLVAGGEIRHDEAVEALTEALAAHGVEDEEKAVGTLHRGLSAGMLEPRAGVTPLTAIEAFGARVPPPPVGEQPVDVPPPPPSFGPPSHPMIVGASNIVDYFNGCAYVADDDAMWVPGGVMLKKSGFDGIFGGPTFALDTESEKTTKSAWETFRTNGLIRLPMAYRTCFRPELPASGIITLEGLPYLNAYTPAVVRRVRGDAAPFVDHVRKMLPTGDDAELLLHWMASCARNAGVKFQWWPVVQGVKGNGKTLLLSCMMHAVGARYSHLVNPEAMQRTGNQFNAWIERKLFLGFEEIHTGEGQRGFTEMMKSTVTNRTIAAEGKGVSQRTVDNRANGMMLTNHDDAVPIDDDERRYGIFWCAQQSAGDLARDGMDGEYFPALYEWLRADGYAIVADYLMTRDLSAAMDPAQDMQRAPRTSSTAAAVGQSFGRLEQEILEAIDEERRGFAGGMVSSIALKQLMLSLRVPVAPKRYPAMMRTLGYVTHPGLTGGRLTAPLPDGTRPRIYLRRDHPALAEDHLRLAEAYQAAQDGTAQPASNVVAFPPR